MKCIMGLFAPTAPAVADDRRRGARSDEILARGDRRSGVALGAGGTRLFPKLTVTENLMLGASGKRLAAPSSRISRWRSRPFRP